MKNTVNRVFLYGIDAGTWEFILPNIDSLPNFKRLINTSMWGELESTIPPVTPAAWTTMFSGVFPQKHRIFGFTENEDPLSISPPSVSKEKIGYPLIWDILSQKNNYVVNLFIPFAYPPPKVRGLFVSGMGTPSKNSKFVYPSYRKGEILEYGINPDVPHDELKDDLNEMKKVYVNNLKSSIELVKYLMEYDPWNLFIYVLEEIDRVQHVFWRYLDPQHPLYVPDEAKKYSSTILEFYKIADSFLGYLFKNLPADAILLIASDHGMGPNHRRIILNNWLYEKGYLFVKGSLESKNAKKIPLVIKKMIKKYKFIQKPLSKIYSKTLGKKLSTIRRWNIDWENTVAYSIHPFLIQMSKHNCKYGTLNKSEVKHYAEEIIKDLKKSKLFGEVGYYSHDFEGCIPDIFVKPKYPTDFVVSFSSNSAKVVEGPINGGEHRMNGIYSIYPVEGDHIKKESNIVNITPTILKILGQNVPLYVDGEPII